MNRQVRCAGGELRLDRRQFSHGANERPAAAHGPADDVPGAALVLWPLAILFIVHRSYVLATNGYITDDYGPVYRAVVNFKRGLDIYNEHLNYVDPHYLYPPGGTLLMAPFGYLPVDASRYWFIFFNTVAMVLAAYLLVRLFNFTFNSVALPAVLAAMFCSEAVINTLVFANINGCVLLLEVLFFRWLLDGKVSHEWWAGVAIGLSLVVKPLLGAAAVAAAAQPAMAHARHRDRRAAGLQPRGVSAGQRPDGLLPTDAAVHPGHPRLLQQLDPGQRHLLRVADVVDRAFCASSSGC